MRAVVVVGGRNDAGFPPADRCPAALLWLVDRPVVQHVCEAVVRLGMTDITWVHCRPADETRKFLGGGERWGARFDHLATDGLDEAYSVARTAVTRPVLLGHADRVPTALPVLTTDAAGPVLGGTPMDQAWVWSGWAALPAGCDLPAAATEAQLVARLSALPGASRQTVARPRVVRSFASYLSATHAVLAGHGGANVSRRARVHPTATLVGPVHVGPDATIGAGAVVGPFVAVGPNCVIDRNARLSHAAVLPDTYVGRGLALGRAVVDRNRVVRLGADGTARLDESLPVGDLSGHPLTGLTPALASRAGKLVRTLRRVPAALTRGGRRAAPVGN